MRFRSSDFSSDLLKQKPLAQNQAYVRRVPSSCVCKHMTIIGVYQGHVLCLLSEIHEENPVCVGVGSRGTASCKIWISSSSNFERTSQLATTKCFFQLCPSASFCVWTVPLSLSPANDSLRAGNDEAVSTPINDGHHASILIEDQGLVSLTDAALAVDFSYTSPEYRHSKGANAMDGAEATGALAKMFRDGAAGIATHK